MARTPEKSLDRARSMRIEPSDAEKKLWLALRSRQFSGFKFRRQHPVGPYITDFACLERRLIIELDGGQHAEQKAYDDARTRYLEKKGYRVLRFWNTDTLANTEGVLTMILDALGSGGEHG
jgi:very-short-patch-repair endonuclease